MNTNRTILILSIALLIFTASAVRAVTHQVSVANFAFTPAQLMISEGDTVRWVWSSGSHTVTSGQPCTADGLFDVAISSGSPLFEHVFDHGVGDFAYFCRPHCSMGMTGTVSVAHSTAVGEDGGALATELPRLTAWPGPFSPDGRLHLELPHATLVRVSVLDLSGRRLAVLADAWMGEGSHEFPWDGRADDGTEVSTGVYFVRVDTPATGSRTRLLMIR